MVQQKEYFAFISYKEDDYDMAKWLQHKLEHYHLPSFIRKDNPALPSRIKPIFEYKSEMAGGYLKPAIEKALAESKYLIVICSPNAPKSKWVADEVQKFIDSGKTDYIIPFVISGEAYSNNPEKECFPEPLKNLKEPLRGISINELGRDAAAIKVVAQMFEVKFDMLWKRYEREQRKKLYQIIAGIASLAILAIIIAWWMHEKNVTLEYSNRKVLENQGRFVAKQMESVIDDGDLYTAFLVGTEMLTQEGRPYVPQIEIALRRAYDSICSVGLHPVSVLKYSMSEPYGIGRPSIVSFSTDSKHIQIAYEWELEASEKPICVYSSITGELQKETMVDYVCEDSMNIIGYEKCINIEKNGEEFWSPDESFMLKVFYDRCVIYKRNSIANYVKYPIDWGRNLEKNSISKNSKYAIFRDSIFYFQSGKSIRHLGTPYGDQYAIFSPNDKYIVIFSEDDMIIAVEDFQTKKILSTIEISEYALPPKFDKDDNLYVPVVEDSFYVYKIPSLEIIDKGVADSEKEEYAIDIIGKDVILLLI